MHYFRRQFWPVAAIAIGLVAASPLAAQQKTPTSSGAGWGGTVNKNAETAGQALTPEQMQAVEAINTYFNGVQHLKGRFAQTNPDKKVQRGKFFIKRPGRFRFNYNRPSRQIIVSDGTYLAIQDLDLKNEDIFTLKKTPFRILLRKDVNVLRDARILKIDQSDTQIAVALADKDPDSSGQIIIYLSRQPKVELAGWVTTDVQGGVTKVEVSNIERPEDLPASYFRRKKLFSPQGSND